MDTKFAENCINGLKNGGHDSKAETVQNLLNEYNRLLNIFKKLDKMYQPHSPETPFGLLDSPQSLIEHTKEAINSALEKD